MKRCTKCKEEKSFDAFFKNQYWCKQCQQQYHKYLYDNNPDYRKKRLEERQQWQDNNYRSWLEGNHKYTKQWYESHREEHQANGKKWRKENPETQRKIEAKIHAKRYQSLGWIELYPNPFSECEIVHGHHINDIHVVYLPRDLHQLYGGCDVEAHRENLSYIVEQIYER